MVGKSQQHQIGINVIDWNITCVFSEMQESVEDVYRAIGGHLAGKSSLMQLFLLDNALHLADDTGFKVGFIELQVNTIVTLLGLGSWDHIESDKKCILVG